MEHSSLIENAVTTAWLINGKSRTTFNLGVDIAKNIRTGRQSGKSTITAMYVDNFVGKVAECIPKGPMR